MATRKERGVEAEGADLALEDSLTVQIEQVLALRRIATALERIESYIDCGSANWGRGA